MPAPKRRLAPQNPNALPVQASESNYRGFDRLSDFRQPPPKRFGNAHFAPVRAQASASPHRWHHQQPYRAHIEDVTKNARKINLPASGAAASSHNHTTHRQSAHASSQLTSKRRSPLEPSNQGCCDPRVDQRECCRHLLYMLVSKFLPFVYGAWLTLKA